MDMVGVHKIRDALKEMTLSSVVMQKKNLFWQRMIAIVLAVTLILTAISLYRVW